MTPKASEEELDCIDDIIKTILPNEDLFTFAFKNPKHAPDYFAAGNLIGDIFVKLINTLQEKNYNNFPYYVDVVVESVTIQYLRDGEKYSQVVYEKRFDELKHAPWHINKMISFIKKKYDKSQNSDEKPLGDFAWAEEREDVPYEKNTNIENVLYDILVSHFEDSESVKKDKEQFIKKLFVSGKYSDVLVAPSHGVVYRGMTVPHKWLTNVLGYNSIEDLKEEFGSEGHHNLNCIYTPKDNAISSWTTNMNVANSFALRNSLNKKPPKGSCRIVLYAKSVENKNNFLSCDEGLYNVRGFDASSQENEVIGLGDIKVFLISWDI